MSKNTRLTGDYRQYMDKNFIGEWDLPEHDDLKVTIDHVEQNDVKNERGSETKLCIYFRERQYKPLILNATNGANIKQALGSGHVEKWEGRSILLYRESVSAFGKTTMAVRVRPFAPREEEYYCEDCGCKIEKVDRYTPRAIAESSRKKFGATLCMDCAKARKEEQEQQDREGDFLNDEDN